MLLEPHTDEAAAAVLKLPPTGLSLFIGHSLPGHDELQRRLALIPARPSDEEISSLSRLSPSTAVPQWLISDDVPRSIGTVPLGVNGEGGRQVIAELEQMNLWRCLPPVDLVLARNAPLPTFLCK